MILANGCNITKSEKFKGVWILSVTTVYQTTIFFMQQKYTLSRHLKKNIIKQMFYIKRFKIKLMIIFFKCIFK